MRTNSTSASPVNPLTTLPSKSPSIDYKSPSPDRTEQCAFRATTGIRVTLYFTGKEKMTDVIDILKTELKIPSDKVATVILGGREVIIEPAQYHYLKDVEGRNNLIFAENLEQLERANREGHQAASYVVKVTNQ